MAFDSAGNLYIADRTGVSVLPKESDYDFGIKLTAATLTPLVSGLDQAWGVAFDATGNLYISHAGGVSVLPRVSGSIFGIAVTENTLAMVVSVDDEPLGLAFDSSGDLYVANGDDVSVLAKSSGTVFGVAVKANTLTTLVAESAGTQPLALAFDAAGDLYLLGGQLWILPRVSGTVFGVAVTADSLALLVTGELNVQMGGLAFDRQGDLYLTEGDDDSVLVLPRTSGTLFGVPVIANTPKTIASNVDQTIEPSAPDSGSEMGYPTGLAIDTSGDLFISTALSEGVSVLAQASGLKFRVPVTIHALNQLVPSPGYVGALAFDVTGDLFVASGGAIWVRPKASGVLFGRSVTASRWSIVAFGDGAALAFDSAGNLYVAMPSGVWVLPRTSGTVFGISVTANVLASVAPRLDGQADGLAFDADDDLYILTRGTRPPYLSNDGTLQVIVKRSKLLFGASVVADIPTTLQTFDALYPMGLAADRKGDLVITSFSPFLPNPGSYVQVLPKSSGSFFGVADTANTLTTISSALNGEGSAAFDAAGDLFINACPQPKACISVFPKSSGTLFRVSVTANHLSAVIPDSQSSPAGPLAFDVARNLYGSQDLNAVVVEYKATADTASAL